MSTSTTNPAVPLREAHVKVSVSLPAPTVRALKHYARTHKLGMSTAVAQIIGEVLDVGAYTPQVLVIGGVEYVRA